MPFPMTYAKFYSYFQEDGITSFTVYLAGCLPFLSELLSHTGFFIFLAPNWIAPSQPWGWYVLPQFGIMMHFKQLSGFSHALMTHLVLTTSPYERRLPFEVYWQFY